MMVGALSTLQAWATNNGWEKIDVPTRFEDDHGVWRYPGCSGGPVPTLQGLIPADTTFSFFIRRGDPQKLLIAWDGGGACWDPNTCVGSAIEESPIYDLTVGEKIEDEIDVTAGIYDRGRPDNPLGDYTQLFIPYCTGDLHTGAKDTTYSFTTAEGTVIPWTIHHRGFDNVVAVLSWLMQDYDNAVGQPPLDVFLTGASAGGYGVLYAYPVVDTLLPRNSHIRVLSDSANGVVNQDFYNRALGDDSIWGIRDNLAPELVHAFESGPDFIASATYQSLGWHYPYTHFGQYTRAYDAVQVFFYNVARHIDSPELWYDPAQLMAAGQEWAARTHAYMGLSALTTWNYRFYLAQGMEHTIIGDANFYTEDSAEGVRFSNWVNDMIKLHSPEGSDWRNVSCAPHCSVAGDVP